MCILFRLGQLPIRRQTRLRGDLTAGASSSLVALNRDGLALDV